MHVSTLRLGSGAGRGSAGRFPVGGIHKLHVRYAVLSQQRIPQHGEFLIFRGRADKTEYPGVIAEASDMDSGIIRNPRMQQAQKAEDCPAGGGSGWPLFRRPGAQDCSQLHQRGVAGPVRQGRAQISQHVRLQAFRLLKLAETVNAHGSHPAGDKTDDAGHKRPEARTHSGQGALLQPGGKERRSEGGQRAKRGRQQADRQQSVTVRLAGPGMVTRKRQIAPRQRDRQIETFAKPICQTAGRRVSIQQKLSGVVIQSAEDQGAFPPDRRGNGGFIAVPARLRRQGGVAGSAVSGRFPACRARRRRIGLP